MTIISIDDLFFNWQQMLLVFTKDKILKISIFCEKVPKIYIKIGIFKMNLKYNESDFYLLPT